MEHFRTEDLMICHNVGSHFGSGNAREIMAIVSSGVISYLVLDHGNEKYKGGSSRDAVDTYNSCEVKSNRNR